MTKAVVNQMIQSARAPNSLSNQKARSSATSNKFSKIEKISGTVRVLDVTASSSPQLLYMDFDGFSGAQANLLTDVMRNYDKWAIDELKIHYTPQVSKTAAGTVAFAPDFDPNDIPALTAQVLSVSDLYKSWNISDEKVITITQPYSRKSPEDMLYVAPTSDPRFTSAGFLNFIVNTSETGTVGFIEMSYVIRLYLKTPRPPLVHDFNDTTLTVYNNGVKNYVLNEDMPSVKNIHVTAPTPIDFSQVLSGILGNTVEGELRNSMQQVIRAGTRVFFKTANKHLDSTDNVISDDSTSVAVGLMALDRHFNHPLRWFGSSTTTGSIPFTRMTFIN